MNSERSNAYGRVMQIIRDVGPAKLQPFEVQTIRDAADTLLFAEDVAAPGAADAIERIGSLADHLEATDRWSRERARELADNVFACGPAGRVSSLAPAG